MTKLEFDDGLLWITCSGANFSEQIESCKYLGMVYDLAHKKWSISPGRLSEVQAEFSQYGLQISEYDKLQINNYIDSITDFEKITKRSERRALTPSLLNHQALSDFQNEDVTKAVNQTALLFNWATGCGKSWALASILANLRSIGECYKALILTSSIGTMNLGKELEKFVKGYDPGRTLTINSVTDLGKDRAVFNDDYDIVICNYDTFRFINDYYDKTVHKRTKKVKYRKSAIPFDKWFGDKKGLLFMDECHLATGRSGRTDVIFMNLKYFKYRYLFSATPTDKEEKFYSLLRIMNNGLVKGLSYLDWCSQFCEIGTRFSAYQPNLDTWDQNKWSHLQDEISGLYIVTRDKSLLNLPPAIKMPLIHITMSPEHRAVYEAFSYLDMEMIKKKNDQTHSGLVNELCGSFQILQMAVENPEMIVGSKVMHSIDSLNCDKQLIDNFKNALKNFNYDKHFAKLPALDNIVQYECNELGNKMIIFYYHPATMQALHRKYPDAFVLSADVEKKDRFQLIEDFKKSDQEIIIMSILIGNTSFTLNEVKACVYFERSWSGIEMEQSEGRFHRIGQTDEVRIYNMLYDCSIDNIQLDTIESKGKTLESLGKKANLTPEEWRTLLGGSKEDQDLFFTKIS